MYDKENVRNIILMWTDPQLRHHKIAYFLVTTADRPHLPKK